MSWMMMLVGKNGWIVSCVGFVRVKGEVEEVICVMVVVIGISG